VTSTIIKLVGSPLNLPNATFLIEPEVGIAVYRN
jgi:hypothetical protein